MPVSILTEAQLQAYTAAVAKALGVSTSMVAPYVKTQAGAQRRRLLSAPAAAFTVLDFAVYAPFKPSATLRGGSRSLLQDPLGDMVLTFAVLSEPFEFLVALAGEISAQSFQSNLNVALRELGLAPAVVDPGSVQFFNVPPSQSAQQPRQTTPTARPRVTTPAPDQPPPAFSGGQAQKDDLDATAGVLVGFLTLLALAYILPSDCDEPWDP